MKGVVLSGESAQHVGHITQQGWRRERKCRKCQKCLQVLRMKGGIGEESYANNSNIQKGYQNRSMPLLEQAVLELCCTTLPTEYITIADLGCGSGPNTLYAVSEIMSIIHKRCCQLSQSSPEFGVFLNDLPWNDFNTVFKSLPAFHEKMKKQNGEEFGPLYIGGVSGSFYGRLFPSRSLNFVYSSTSLQWLSQVPPELNDRANKEIVNKGKIYISKTSSPAVIKAYVTQFQRDFSLFLKSRAEEIIPGGRMVLSFRGRRLADPSPDESCLLWDLLAQAFQDLVLEGLVVEEKLDSYNTPYYEPYTEEIRAEIEKEGSFTLDRLVSTAMPWDGVNGGKKCDRVGTAQQMAKAMRAVQESMIQSHFGAEIMDPLFERFVNIMVANTKEVEHVSVVLSMVRKS
ncbi:hypothetical protein L1049_024226 [Liquidambar formosana]|uniref:Uncharacterized protein n=1 Tax=Liquidambar formosana TaxID=63359 RepID=A0AAP0RUY7_LIQFO